MFEIEKNVARVKVNVRTKYPFVNMEVGDSFSMPAEGREKVITASHSFARANGRKFSTLKQPDGTYRCWRIS